MKRARGRASSPEGTKRATVTFADLEARSKKTVKRIQTIQRGNFKVIDPEDLTPLGIFINHTMKVYMRRFVPARGRSPDENEMKRIFAVIRRVPQSHTKWTEEHIRMLITAIGGVFCFPGCDLISAFLHEWRAFLADRPDIALVT
ncbi:hypothetical protein PAPYR_5915 [Paratrimastix pyriformis]|uniref:Uncharacterized protein n=1 Tax=Paratrimastix pyriformis TaxID=342808 RepID=A0ABQ8UHT6_9EUKA|nr:hypothetical protein PAPYR_5915 [Paratrimastix pyriformis]